MRARRAGAAYGSQSEGAGEWATYCVGDWAICGCGMSVQHCWRAITVHYGAVDYVGCKSDIEWSACFAARQPGDLCTEWNSFDHRRDTNEGDGNVIWSAWPKNLWPA